MSIGDAYQVRHPEFTILLKSQLVIGLPDQDRVVIFSLLHIANVTKQQAA